MNIHVPAATGAPNSGMQVTTFENPMGIDGIEFVEFAAPAGQAANVPVPTPNPMTTPAPVQTAETAKKPFWKFWQQ